MKIEKISDNQIRCTLTQNDLADRQLKLSELVCGTEKAKSLFHDMMEQAASEFGFEAEDMPLMIEAIPTSSDSIVLIITKVDNPEELDGRFSKFGPTVEKDLKKRHILDKLEGADHILDLLNKVKDAVSEVDTPQEKEQEAPQLPGMRLFSFANIDCVIHASHMLKDMYHGANTLYKDLEDDAFILAITQSEHTTKEFHKICNMLSEYGALERASGGVLAFLEEHCEVYITDDAVQQLSNI